MMLHELGTRGIDSVRQGAQLSPGIQVPEYVALHADWAKQLQSGDWDPGRLIVVCKLTIDNATGHLLRRFPFLCALVMPRIVGGQPVKLTQFQFDPKLYCVVMALIAIHHLGIDVRSHLNRDLPIQDRQSLEQLCKDTANACHPSKFRVTLPVKVFASTFGKQMDSGVGSRDVFVLQQLVKKPCANFLSGEMAMFVLRQSDRSIGALLIRLPTHKEDDAILWGTMFLASFTHLEHESEPALHIIEALRQIQDIFSTVQWKGRILKPLPIGHQLKDDPSDARHSHAYNVMHDSSTEHWMKLEGLHRFPHEYSLRVFYQNRTATSNYNPHTLIDWYQFVG